jgi:hypothetical protein
VGRGSEVQRPPTCTLVPGHEIGSGRGGGRRRVVGMGLERTDGDVHPLVERQGPEQIVELGAAVGPVQAERPGPAGCDGPLPEPDEMASARQLGRGRCLGVLAVVDLSLRSPVGNVDLEVNQKFHELLL